MSNKNQKINFATINDNTMLAIRKFAKARIDAAAEDVNHKKVLKPLNVKLAGIIQNREDELAKGTKSHDEITAMFPRDEVDAEIRKENNRHDKVMKPLNEAMRGTYAMIPDTMFDAYKRKIEENKRGDFLDACKVFVNGLGIEGATDTAIRRMSEELCDKMGARVSSSKKLLEKAAFTSAMNKNGFNKLFMSAFADLLVTKKAFTIEGLADIEF